MGEVIELDLIVDTRDIDPPSGRRDIGIGTQISTNGEEELSATVDRVAFRREVATEFSLGLDGGSD